MKKIIALLILATFAVALYLYPMMPEQMASHWNMYGEVDGYMDKFWGLFFIPVMSVAMFVLFLILPSIDPMKKNIQKFRKYYDGFILVFTLFFLYLYVLMISWNLGYTFNMMQSLIPAFAGLFYYMGVMIGHARRNWFVGIRTPWTMSSDKVWDKTHKLGGKLFRIFGIIILLGILIPKYAFFILMIPAIGVSLFTVLYSYLEFRSLK